jgi:hypothetical protein
MPAALALGLEQITKKSLQELRAVLGSATGPSHAAVAGHAPATSPPSLITPAQEEDADATPAGKSWDSSTAVPDSDQASIDPPRLILVGWTPSRLSPHRPVDLDRVIRSVETVGNCLGAGVDEVFLWRPTMREIRRIGFCLTKGNRKDVTKAILDSLDQSAKSLTPSESGTRPLGDLLASRARLRQVLLRPGAGPEHRRRRLREYQRAVDNTFVEPLLARAGNESDLDERSRLGGLAAVNRLLHPSVELYSAKLEQEIARTGLRGDGPMFQTQELMKMFDVLYKFAKESK